MIHRRHEHDVAAGDAQVCDDAGAFCTDGPFRHLDDDFIAFFEHVFDRLDPAAPDAAVGAVAVLQRVVDV